jgi:folate-dependent phosphoribosylglycinamide formyltransferase PurN
MRILSATSCATTGRLLNIHPSLLPKYKGLHTHQRALEAGDASMAAACTSSPRNSMAGLWSYRQ